MKFVLAGVLVITALASAFGANYTQHEHRRYFAKWQVLIQNRDDLNTEWGRLQLERGVLTTHNLIERKALNDLKMNIPTMKDIVFVKPVERGG